MRDKKLVILLAALCLYFAVQLPFLTVISRVWVDEPWYGGTAYNFSEGRGFTNENVVGMYGGDVVFGYPLFLGSFMRLFGGSLMAARLFSVICGAVLLAISFFILKELNASERAFAVFYLLFILSSTVYIAFRTVRPEAVKIVFSSLALLFLLKGISKNTLFLAPAGAAIAAAALCHPDEIMFASAFFIMLAVLSVKRRNPDIILRYIIGVSMIALLFALFLHFVKNMTLYDFYLYYGRRLSAYEGTLLGNLLLKAKNLIEDYGLGAKRIYVLLFETAVFITGALFFRRDKRILTLSVIGGTFFLFSFVFLERIVTRGFISIIIYSVIVFSLMLDSLWSRKTARNAAMIFGAMYLLNNLAAIGYLVLRDRGNTSYAEIEEFIDKKVEDKKTVLSHINYYFPLKNNILYNDYTIYKLTEFLSLDSLLACKNIDYAVLSSSALTNETGTSGRTEKKESVADFERFYDKALKYSDENLVKEDSLVTKGYGTIYIYVKKHNID